LIPEAKIIKTCSRTL